MKTADELIDKIKIDEGNFHHITVTHKINGTLREEIRKAMSLFAMQEVIEALKLHGVVDPSTQKNEFVTPDVSNTLLCPFCGGELYDSILHNVPTCKDCGAQQSNDC